MSFLFCRTAGIPLEITICFVYSVYSGELFFCPKFPTLLLASLLLLFSLFCCVLAVVGDPVVVGFPALAASLLVLPSLPAMPLQLMASLLLLRCIPVCDARQPATVIFVFALAVFGLVALLFSVAIVPVVAGFPAVAAANVVIVFFAIGIAVWLKFMLSKTLFQARDISSS
jgi:hypothetical protein